MKIRISLSSFALVLSLLSSCSTTGQQNNVSPVSMQDGKDGMHGGTPSSRPEDWADQGELVTLYAADTNTDSMNFFTGGPGGIIQDHQVKNRGSQMNFDGYYANAFTVGIQGGERGYIVDLGSSVELAERYQYNETVGYNLGFASIRFEAGQLVIQSDHPDAPTQPLVEGAALSSQDRNANHAPTVFGHVYLARIQRGEDPAKDLYIKFKVVEHIPNQSATIRWMQLPQITPTKTVQPLTPR